MGVEWLILQSPARSACEDAIPLASLLHLDPPTPQSCNTSMMAPCPSEFRGLELKQIPPPTVEEVFLGASCASVDCGHGAGGGLKNLSRFLDPLCQQPVILKHFARHLLDLPVPWTFDTLDKMCGPAQVDGVRVAKPGSSTFDYAEKCKKGCFSDSSAEGQLEPMLFTDFISRLRSSAASPYYLWSVLLAAEAGQENLVPSTMAELLWQDLKNFKWEQIEPLRQIGELGSVKKVQLFCSGPGAVTSCHYDQSQNLFLQMEGTKRFILFPPLVGAAALMPFPISHPRDRCARARLQKGMLSENGPFTSCSRYPCSKIAHGQGVEAILEPGDVLFLPQMWWHHVESLAEENVSLSIWFRGGALEQRPVPARLLQPLPGALALELAREWEFYLATQIGILAGALDFWCHTACSQVLTAQIITTMTLHVGCQAAIQVCHQANAFCCSCMPPT